MANVAILFLPFGTLSELLVLLVDLHNGTSTKKHIQVKRAAACHRAAAAGHDKRQA